MSQIGWRHHALVQALLSRGPLPEKEVHSIFHGVSGKNPVTQKQLFTDYLLKINRELAYVQFELRGCRNQYDGEVYYGVVNNVADEQSKLGSKYSLPQIAFYKGIVRLKNGIELVEVEAIMTDPLARGYISHIEALYARLEDQVQTTQSSQDNQSWISPAFKNFSMSQKEKTLSDLIHDGWLHSSSDHNVGLGVRSFLDLRSWFRTNDVPSCEACNEAAVKAELCSKDDCTVRIHRYCLKQIFKKKAARACPGCGTPWNLSEEDENDTEEENPTQTQVNASNPPVNTRRLRSCKAETIEITADIKAPQIPTRRKSQRVGSRNR